MIAMVCEDSFQASDAAPAACRMIYISGNGADLTEGWSIVLDLPDGLDVRLWNL
jgi:hypothetical protein